MADWARVEYLVQRFSADESFKTNSALPICTEQCLGPPVRLLRRRRKRRRAILQRSRHVSFNVHDFHGSPCGFCCILHVSIHGFFCMTICMALCFA